jgi:phospholipid N-methyltransferase
MNFFSEWRTFFRECRRNFRDTGSVMPSSRFLARAMASEMSKPRGPARILEVGPGTGAVTRTLLRKLQPGDQLDLVELNERFFQVLQERFACEPDFAPYRDRVQLIQGAVQTLPGESLYDFIVSGLPLNNFPVSLVRVVFRTFHRLLKPGGTLSYFEYTWARHLKTPFCGRRERVRLGGVGVVVGKYVRDCQIRRDHVLVNVPPAIVRHLRLKPAVAEATSDRVNAARG